jgi:hypothetical protein
MHVILPQLAMPTLMVLPSLYPITFTMDWSVPMAKYLQRTKHKNFWIMQIVKGLIHKQGIFLKSKIQSMKTSGTK